MHSLTILFEIPISALVALEVMFTLLMLRFMAIVIIAITGAGWHLASERIQIAVFLQH
jgi:hypothetical protein